MPNLFSFIFFSFCSEQKHYNARFNRFFQLLLFFKIAEFRPVSSKLPVAGLTSWRQRVKGQLFEVFFFIYVKRTLSRVFL